MPTILSRTAVAEGDTLGLTREHELVTLPRKGTIDWASFNRSQFDEASLENARTLWSHRAFTEFHSLTQFTQLASQLHLLGAPLDWSGAFARMVSDEVRHAELCLHMVQALGGFALGDAFAAGAVDGQLHGRHGSGCGALCGSLRRAR